MNGPSDLTPAHTATTPFVEPSRADLAPHEESARRSCCAGTPAPCYSLVFELDLAAIESLVVEMGTAPFVVGAPVRVDSTEDEFRDAAFRLLHL